MKNKRLPEPKRLKGRRFRSINDIHRLFIGIFPTPEYLEFIKNTLRAFDKQKRNLRNIPMDQIHLTIKFIGAQVSDSSRDAIISELEKNANNYPKPEIKIDSVKFGFKYQNDPRILMVSVEANNDLVDLNQVIHDRIRELRLKDTIRWKARMDKDFHISISKLKESATRSSGKEMKKILESHKNFKFPETFVAEYIDVIESVFTPGGVVYRKLARVKL